MANENEEKQQQQEAVPFPGKKICVTICSGTLTASGKKRRRREKRTHKRCKREREKRQKSSTREEEPEDNVVNKQRKPLKQLRRHSLLLSRLPSQLVQGCSLRRLRTQFCMMVGCVTLRIHRSQMHTLTHKQADQGKVVVSLHVFSYWKGVTASGYVINGVTSPPPGWR